MKRIFDVHVHYPAASIFSGHVNGPESRKELQQMVEEFQKYNVVKVCLLVGAGEINDLVLEAARTYPDLIVPMAYVNMDGEKPEFIDEVCSKGFKGIKIIGTQKPYDTSEYYPFYERAERNGLVALFHTGILGGISDYLNIADPKEVTERTLKVEQALKSMHTTSNNMRAAYLDTIGMNFPELKVIGAHLGYGDYDIACAVARWRRKVYFDLSGGDVVRRHLVERNYIKKEISPSKLIFGSDCITGRIGHEVMQWTQMLTYMGLEDEEIDNILYKNAAFLFGME